MDTIDLNSLLERLSPGLMVQLEAAANKAVALSVDEISVDLLLECIVANEGKTLLSWVDEGQTLMLSELRNTLDFYDPVSARRAPGEGLPSFSSRLIQLLKESWLTATLNLSSQSITLEAVFLTLLSNPLSYLNRQTRTLLRTLSVAKITESSQANVQAERNRAASSALKKEYEKPAAAEMEFQALQKYARNLTQEARAEDKEPVLYRELEILKLTNILLQRKKNNVILVGEPGVGKTAVVEGFAQYLIQDNLPEKLTGSELWELDLTALQAGASVKGEFENRMKNLLEDIQNYPSPVILFVDEAHMLMGAGGAQGTSDAANMLKPALARGSLKLIAATTWSEYKKYIEKDAALARRLQMVIIDPPSLSQAKAILSGLKPHYEQDHGVRILTNAVDAAVELSERYLAERQLPDKALDLLDMACATVSSSLSVSPKQIQLANRELQMFKRELDMLRADEAGGFTVDDERRAELEDKVASCEKNLAELETIAAQRREQILAYQAMVEALNEAGDEEAPDTESIKQAREAIEKQVEGADFYDYIVDEQIVASTLSDLTGIPVAMIRSDNVTKVKTLDEQLMTEIKGQDEAVCAIHQALLSSVTDVKNPNTPVGSFLLVGPSGVGKTETALQLADMFYGSKSFMTTINMSEYQEKHTVSRLIGSPPGYVGYGEGGVLTEAIRKKPYSLVLLDEVEKAHPDVLNIFYQGFDKGEIMDGEGRKINCKNILFLMTSNIGFDSAEQRFEMLDQDALREKLLAFFKPALLARMDIVQYGYLSAEVLREIITLKLSKVIKRIANNYRVELLVDSSVYSALEELSGVHANGARLIDNIINKQILPPLSLAILEKMAKNSEVVDMKLSYADKQFQVKDKEG